MIRLPRFSMLVMLAVACAHNQPEVDPKVIAFKQVRARAAFDFNCDEEKVSVKELVAGQYGARGCGRSMKCRDVPFAGLVCDDAKTNEPPDATSDAPTTNSP